MRLAIVAAMLGATPLLLSGQDVRTDPVTGNYYVTVYNDDLEPVEILVEVANRVQLTATTTIAWQNRNFRYVHRVALPPQSPQALGDFHFDCPASGHRIAGLSAGTTYQGTPRSLTVSQASWSGLPSCIVSLGAAPLQPGEHLHVEVEAGMLPAIGEARALGHVRGVSWPSDGIPENDSAREFVRSVQGITGGWKAVPAVVPTRDPAVFEDPAGGLDLLRDDLRTVCGDLSWISNQGVCRSLQAKLDAAARSVERGRTESARGELRAFIQELDAQHGPEPGKHVNDNAYALMRTNAAYLLERF